VSGAAGAVGSAATELVSARDAEVMALVEDRSEQAALDPGHVRTVARSDLGPPRHQRRCTRPCAPLGERGQQVGKDGCADAVEGHVSAAAAGGLGDHPLGVSTYSPSTASATG
jgi:NADPH:quinone reductase-like Zn-dependent oxidoreductase